MLEEHVKKNIAISEMWPKLLENWRRVRAVLEDKYSAVNSEYEDLMFRKE